MNSGPTIKSGSNGNDVRRLQRLLAEMKLIAARGIDGIFGPRTATAVQEFQQGEGLVADGVVGPRTWAALPANPDTPELAQGAHGAEVSAVQTVLTQTGSSTDPGPVDGQFGPRTRAAVIAYQKRIGVPADGVVGDLTWFSPAGAAGATLASLAHLTTV